MLSGVDSSTLLCVVLYFVFAGALLAGEGNLVVLERDLSELARAEDGFAEVELSEVELTDAVEGDFFGSDRHLAEWCRCHRWPVRTGLGVGLGSLFSLPPQEERPRVRPARRRTEAHFLVFISVNGLMCDTMTEGKVPPYEEQR